MIVCQRQARPFGDPSLRLKQPGGEADQARLPAAIRTGDQQRLTAGERNVEMLEQHSSAAAKRDSIEPQQQGHSEESSSACMSSSEKPK